MIFEILSFSDLSLEAIFQVFIVQGFLFFLFLVFGINVILRGRKKINFLLTGFYISVSIGFLFNFFLVFVQIELLTSIIYYLILFFLFLGTFFLAIFTMYMKFGEQLPSQTQKILFLAYITLLFVMLLLTPTGLTINESTGWHPVYSDFYFGYMMALLSISFSITLYYTISILNSITVKLLKQRWKLFVFGIFGLFIFAYTTLIIYKLLSGVIVLIMSMIDFILVILSSIFIYYGAIKKIE